MSSKMLTNYDLDRFDDSRVDDERAQATIRPFRSLPSGRAVVGALLIAIAAVGAFVLAGQNEVDRRVAYLVASEDLAPGQQLEADDIETQLIELPPALAAAAFTNPDELVGAAALGPVGAGEVFWQTGLTPPTLGADGTATPTVEFSFAVARERSPRSLRSGEHIALLSTIGRDDKAVTTVVVANALVTDVELDNESFASAGDVTITISMVDTDAVLAAVNAAQATDVTIIRIPADGSLALPKSSNIDTDGAVDGD